MQPRVVTWRAVSSEEQAQKESLSYQRNLNNEHLARVNGVLIAELEVPGISRKLILWEDACRKMEAYAQLNELIQRQAFDILICQDATRLGRRKELVANMVALCAEAGIRVYEASAPPASIDGPVGSADEQLIMMFKGWQAEQESRKFAERSLFGRKAQVRKGHHMGSPPTGLKKVYDEAGNVHTVIDEDKIYLVKEFIDLYLKHGLSLRAVAQEFNARGYPRPTGKGLWDQAGIYRFLEQRWVYAGYSEWGKQSKNRSAYFRAKAQWPAIITEETVRLLEEEMKKRSNGPRAAWSPNRFSFVLRCGYCGNTVTCKVKAGYQAVDRIYRNTCYACVKECKGTYITEQRLRDAAVDAVYELQNEALFEQMVGNRPEDNRGLPEQIAAERKLLEQTQAERNKLTRAFMRDTISVEEYEAIMAELKERQNSQQQAIAQLENELAQVPTREQRRARLADIRDNGLEMIDHPDIATANAWIRRHYLFFVRENKVFRVHLY